MTKRAQQSRMLQKTLDVVLVGNPNCGKSALFNALTGLRQRVGNWPGVTVDKKTGWLTVGCREISLVDLPGCYSLTNTQQEIALDQQIACDYLLEASADVIVNVIDATHFERNLYLTTQLAELDIPMVIAVNMLDILEKRGLAIDLVKLAKRLRCPVVGIVANRKQGIEQLKQAIVQLAQQPQCPALGLQLPDALVQVTDQLTDVFTASGHRYPRYLAQSLLEHGELQSVAGINTTDLLQARQARLGIQQMLTEDIDILYADARFGFAEKIADAVIRLVAAPKRTLTQMLDKVLLNRFLGVPIFFAMMYLMFVFAINVGGAFQDLFDISSNTLFVTGLSHLLTSWHWPAFLVALLSHGIGMGINTTITFVPVIAAMFVFLALLEDSGYMARAAFVMDRFMGFLGLPGKAFVPMIVGFGCNVPAVMGARTLANRRDRILTILMTPFMSCGARLAIFAVFTAAFFPHGGQTIIFLLYLIGIVVAVLTGLLLRKTLLPGKPEPLIMELPPYHLPQVSEISRQAWRRLKHFICRAGKVILPVCLLIGTLNSINLRGELVATGDQHSMLAKFGQTLTPILAPIGVTQKNWPATVGLLTGVLAKEVVVGTLNTLYSQAGHTNAQYLGVAAGLQAALLSVPQNLANLTDAFKNPFKASEAPHEMTHSAFGAMTLSFSSQAAAFAYLLFVLLYFPCVSTMAAIRRELGRHWAIFSVAWSTLLAYLVAVVCYQLLVFKWQPVISSIWLGSVFTVLLIIMLSFKCYRYYKNLKAYSVAVKLAAGSTE